MKKFRALSVGIGIVTVWAAFAFAYLGFEDGSSGLSVLGWLHAAFFIPGGAVIQLFKGSHTNTDLPLMGLISWLTFTLVSVGMVLAVRIRR